MPQIVGSTDRQLDAPGSWGLHAIPAALVDLQEPEQGLPVLPHRSRGGTHIGEPDPDRRGSVIRVKLVELRNAIDRRRQVHRFTSPLG